MSRGSATSMRMAAILGTVAGAGVICIALGQWSVLSRRNTILDLQDLPVNSAVRLVGVVTYIDSPGARFWIQDETGAAPIAMNSDPAGLRIGETVSVEATKTSRYDRLRGPVSAGLEHVQVRPTLAKVKLPQPFPVALENFPTPDKNGTRVQITAIVRSASRDALGRAHLSIAGSGREIEIIVAKPDRDDSQLIDARVRFVGLPEQIRTPEGALVGNHVWVPSGRDLTIEQPAPAQVPLYSIRSLYTGSHNGHRLRIRGRVATATPDAITLEDQWGAIECRLSAPQPLQPGWTVEAEGFPTRTGLRFDLFHAQAVVLSREPVESTLDPGPAPAPLTTVSAIRNLSAAEAEQALPVRITGVITYIDPHWRQLFVQDRSGGIYVKYSGNHPELAAGNRATLVGITGAGDFAPVIVAPKFIPAGVAPLPDAVPVAMEKAAAGSLDAQYVSVEGIVHPIKVEGEFSDPTLTFELLGPIGQVHVSLAPLAANLEQAQHLADARVRIRGVFGTVFNARRQLVGYQLAVQDLSNIDVIEPAVADPFAMETTAIGSLLRYSPRASFGHRVKVEGIVTLVEPNFLYLQDATDGVQVRGNTHSVHVGDLVDAIGYPTLVGRYSPVMSDAVFQTLSHEGAIQPRLVTAETLLQGNEDSMLVSVEGKLLAAVDGPARKSLVLQSGVRTFTAQLENSDQGTAPWRLQEGSVLRLTGVSSTQVDPGRLYAILDQDPIGFQILLRSPRDLTIIRNAPFWTLRATLGMLGLLSLLTTGILVWVSVLRRRVRSQTEALRKASETAQAITDLSAAMERVSSEQQFDTQVSVRGSQEIAQLVVGFNTMLSELEQRERAKRDAEARIQHMALIDDLTGLPNRRLLGDRLSQSLAKAKRENRMLALLYIDLDGFKLVNDSLGHSVGDFLLGEVAQRLKTRFRESDTLARIGSDEFTLILDHIHNVADTERTAENVLEVLKAPFAIEGHAIRITASIGISIFPDHGEEGGQLLQQADCAMYEAKRRGKSCFVQFGDDLGNAARERLTLEGELRRAIEEGEITVHYQPEFDLAQNTIVRFEALARWTHPTLGPIPPLNFIPIAEESGLIVPLGAHIMERACTDAVAWQRRINRPIQVAVNVSSVQFARDTFIEEVEDILQRTGLAPSLLQIELTESATLAGIERAAAMMRRLRNLGISVAMDDFGTGYSCLSYLPKLAFDALKLDRSFVNELVLHPESIAFVQSILSMAHNLNMKVIVEGIETREQLELMRSLGTNEGQGYLLGRPSPNPLEQLSWSSAIDYRAPQEDLEPAR